jgi:beta-N-acetylhexosaminidase
LEPRRIRDAAEWSRRLAGVALVGVTVFASTAVAGERALPASKPSVARMVGQLLLVRMRGTTPTTGFLARVREGEVGGVVLYGDNFGPAGPGALVRRLQEAARQGHQPPLLIAVDQEGGTVKRLPGAPSLAPAQMTTAAVAEAQGLATARNLAAAGVNVDLAPVLDVDHGGFIAARAFAGTPAGVARRAPAFARGLASGHVLATAKHFPGLGYATLSTDNTLATVTATRHELQADWLPFRTAIEQRIPLVMVSTAVYTALDPARPAALSPTVVRLLRTTLRFRGAIVTDALDTPGTTRYASPAQAAVRAIAAGDDLVLAAGVTDSYADTDGTSVPTYDALVTAARKGRLGARRIAAAYGRVLALKREARD